MNNYSFINRLKIKTGYGIRLGIKLGFTSSVIYAALLLVFVSLLLVPGKHPDVGGKIMIIILLGFVLFIAGILPATIMGLIGGFSIGFFISLWKNKIQNLAAIAVGTFVGAILALLANYISWLNLSSNGLHDVSGNLVDFQTYLFPPLYSPYFLPGITAILISAYAGWKINGVILPEPNFITEE
jgi:hypothetical protein